MPGCVWGGRFHSNDRFRVDFLEKPRKGGGDWPSTKGIHKAKIVIRFPFELLHRFERLTCGHIQDQRLQERPQSTD